LPEQAVNPNASATTINETHTHLTLFILFLLSDFDCLVGGIVTFPMRQLILIAASLTRRPPVVTMWTEPERSTRLRRTPKA
jgi:hypothetical protein